VEYRNTDTITRLAPQRKRVERGEEKRRLEAREEMIMEMEVANPFKTESAYLITRATKIPPKACNTITTHTAGEYLPSNKR